MRALGTLDDYPNKDKLGEIQRRWKRIEDMKASPIPEIVQSIGKVMTKIDNIEDLLSTALVVGRSVAKKLPWLSARVANRVNPAMGITLTVRDVLDILPYL